MNVVLSDAKKNLSDASLEKDTCISECAFHAHRGISGTLGLLEAIHLAVLCLQAPFLGESTLELRV